MQMLHKPLQQWRKQLASQWAPDSIEKIQYLLSKVFGHPLPYDDFIKTNDLYGEQEPWEIFGNFDEGEMYFFTKLKKVGKKSSNSNRKGDIYKRFSRNVGSGTWTNKGQKVPIYGKKKRGVIGYKRCFRYESRREGVDYDDHNGTWLLQEYTLPYKVMQRSKEEYRDCVLCVLRKKGSGKGVRRKGEENYRFRDENELDYMLGSETNYSDSTKIKVLDDDSVRGSENPTSICGTTIINVLDDDSVRESETSICDPTIINVLDDDNVPEFETSICDMTEINVSGDDSVREFESNICDLTEINVWDDDSIREFETSICGSTESETSICDLTKINMADNDSVLECCIKDKPPIDVECSNLKERKVMFDLNL
ncbi:hypothetical protein CASFOL_026369 [Castilleja foliolosa]|uniref:NAC domain-containing protein n=1 Tax=Castilleja foliolosa TaxID=1961234 RepID=A0ABD3CKK4_9LAMI